MFFLFFSLSSFLYDIIFEFLAIDVFLPEKLNVTVDNWNFFFVKSCKWLPSDEIY